MLGNGGVKMECKNCGHKIDWLNHRYAFGYSCIIIDKEGYSCGCTHPEPLELKI